MIEWIKGYFRMTLINYGLISNPRNTGKEVFNLLLRIASACILIPYFYLGIKETSHVVIHAVAVFVVFVGAFIGSLVGRRFPQIGGYTLLNNLVTFAAAAVTSIIVYGMILSKGVSISDGFEMVIIIGMFSAFFPWLLGLLKSFRIRQVISYMAADDGVETVERNFGAVVSRGPFSDTAIVRPIGWTERRWTAQTYKYHLGLFGMFARLLFAFVYGLCVGSIISIVATLPSIVRVANPGENFVLLPRED